MSIRSGIRNFTTGVGRKAVSLMPAYQGRTTASDTHKIRSDPGLKQALASREWESAGGEKQGAGN